MVSEFRVGELVLVVVQENIICTILRIKLPESYGERRSVYISPGSEARREDTHKVLTMWGRLLLAHLSSSTL